MANASLEILNKNLTGIERTNFNRSRLQFKRNNFQCWVIFKKSELFILSLQQMRRQIDKCRFFSTNHLPLLYRVTSGGFCSADFHFKCDNQPNTF